ncbi:MAG TPA: hypothetical protein VGD71_05300 [Kribbella sp.]
MLAATLAICLIGLPNARCSRRIPAQTPTLNTTANANQARTSVSRSGLPHQVIILKPAIRRGATSVDT